MVRQVRSQETPSRRNDNRQTNRIINEAIKYRSMIFMVRRRNRQIREKKKQKHLDVEIEISITICGIF